MPFEAKTCGNFFCTQMIYDDISSIAVNNRKSNLFSCELMKIKVFWAWEHLDCKFIKTVRNQKFSNRSKYKLETSLNTSQLNKKLKLKNNDRATGLNYFYTTTPTIFFIRLTTHF